MQDFCLRAPDEAAIIAALTAAGLTVADLDGVAHPVGDYSYADQLVETPGQYDPYTLAETVAPVMIPGVYAVYRATDVQAAAILAATLPEGVALVDPPASLPMFGGEWLAGLVLAEEQAARKAAVTAMRNTIRARGVLFGTARLAAMPEDQGAYGDAITYLSWKPEGTIVKWKAASGWIEVDLAALRAAAEAVGDFIEALFEAEHAHHAVIDALASVAAVQAYDIATGWPE